MDTWFAMRAARRAAGSLTWELRDGLSGLASVASVAALLGLLGTCWAIPGAFLEHPELGRPFASMLQERIGEALWWNVFGLALAIAASAGYRRLLDRCHELELELDLILLELPEAFRHLGGAPLPPERDPTDAVSLAERAATRARRSVTGEFGRRLSGLASLASVAAFVGLFGTVLWIAGYTFKGAGASRSTILAATATGLFESLAFNAWGLLIALTATFAYLHLCQRRDQLDCEMQVAIADLSLALRRHRS